MPRTSQVDPAILEAALEGLQRRLEEIDEQIANVRGLLRPRPGRRAAAATSPERAKRQMSPAARRRIARAQRRRWAEFRKAAKGRKRQAKKVGAKAAGETQTE